MDNADLILPNFKIDYLHFKGVLKDVLNFKGSIKKLKYWIQTDLEKILTLKPTSIVYDQLTSMEEAMTHLTYLVWFSFIQELEFTLY